MPDLCETVRKCLDIKILPLWIAPSMSPLCLNMFGIENSLIFLDITYPAD